MMQFNLYLTEAASEEKLTHLEHAEDHVINDGMEGFAHAYHNLEDVKDQVNGKKNKTKIELSTMVHLLLYLVITLRQVLSLLHLSRCLIKTLS